MEIFPESPFLPGHPVTPENFKGRQKDLNKLIKFLPKTKNSGIITNFFVTGKRGMGKTSFVNYVAYELEKEQYMNSVYVNVDKIKSLDELLEKLVEKLISKANTLSWGKKILNILLKYVDQIVIKDVGFKLTSESILIERFKKNFSSFIIDLSASLEEEGESLFIIIDDINGLSKTSEFPSWYKSLMDTISANRIFAPISFCLVSYPEEFDELAVINPSFSRIFERIMIDNIRDKDIEEFSNNF